MAQQWTTTTTTKGHAGNTYIREDRNNTSQINSIMLADDLSNEHLGECSTLGKFIHEMI